MTHDQRFRCMLSDEYEPLFLLLLEAMVCGVMLMERKQRHTHVIFSSFFLSASLSRSLVPSTTMTTVTMAIHVYPYFFLLLLRLLL